LQRISSGLRVALLAVLPFVVSAPAAFGANIVLNPGFETGDFTDWVANGSSNHPWFVDASSAFAGTYDASTGCVGAQCITNDVGAQNPVGAWLYQDLATTASTSYTLSFEFSTGGSPMELQVLWNGNVALDLTGLASGPYNLYTIGGLVATSSTTRLEFLGREDPSYSGLDSVCVSSSTDCGSASAVPEPMTLGLTGFGLAALGFVRFRRRAS